MVKGDGISLLESLFRYMYCTNIIQSGPGMVVAIYCTCANCPYGVQGCGPTRGCIIDFIVWAVLMERLS